ncbi:Putative protease Do-like 3, mitochondrial [Seminavis robusta]|uniref:Protease Do-like 3, mitochondrial n=1 Tax=Seminavis robusta TaxID=568900 RepID=A0A9N8H475_9STRA|nr:Putative protease Do-like 3, mitochondrial [Seminavis robusta]|eukprot:Sro5_g004130.1 Putative protease Do-like 3, mitochondrial (539) ;mRNA; f:62992-64698
MEDPDNVPPADDVLMREATPSPITTTTNNNNKPPTKKAKTTEISFLTGKEGVCRIEVARVEWLTTAPWQRTTQTKSSGTGFCIRDELLLTNAHVVKSAVDIRVRKHGSTRRYAARVAVYAPDVDLALLEIKGADEKKEFFGTHDDLALELAKELPALQESVHVVGFPTGGTTICITEGVVSRIDLVSASAFNNLLAIQIDAAINPGNSGGPAFDKQGKVTGVAFFKNTSKKTDNVGYLIPSSVVETFLGRCQLDRDEQTSLYTLSPSVPYDWHPLENASLRLAHKVPSSIHGVLLTSVSNTLEGILKVGDVLTHVDGKAIADDGQVVLRRDELIQHRYLLRGKRVDEPTIFTVFRDGQDNQQCPPSVLRNIPSICLRWIDVDYPPDYLILGALVLLPMSWALRSHKRCGTRLIGDCIDWCQKWPQDWEGKTGLVVLVDILAHELTFSYSRPWRRVTAYNGTPVLSMEHLRDLWQQSCQDSKAAVEAGNTEPTFARIQLQSDDDIVLEVQSAMAAESEVLARHQIPTASHISPPNPNYK